MRRIFKIIDKLNVERYKLQHYLVGKKLDVSLREAYEKLEVYSHNPGTSCYRADMKINEGATIYLWLFLSIMRLIR